MIEIDKLPWPASESPHRADIVWIPGGTLCTGSDKHYAEEAPVHRVTVDGFWIDRTPVTNRQFREFVKATGHITFAEIAPGPKEYPGALPNMLRVGSLVFSPPKHPVDLTDWCRWWTFKFGANWRRPYGPRSSLSGLNDHPVVHVALAYAKWGGKDLPTEAEWEFAARGGLDGAEFAWGDEFIPGGKQMANTWQDAFPHENLKLDGYERASPVTAFPPVVRTRATTPASAKLRFLARCSRAAHTCVRRITAAVTARPHAMRSRWTPRRAMWVSAAFSAKSQCRDNPSTTEETNKR